MDGFHHYNEGLRPITCVRIKARRRPFDVDRLAQHLWQIKEGDSTWPQYDRQTHDPVEEAIVVTAPVVIVEGNWLLLDDERWRTLMEYCDFSLFIRAPAEALRTRLVGRKLAGGLSQADADAFYARTDGPNVERVLRHSRPANVELMMSANGEYRLV